MVPKSRVLGINIGVGTILSLIIAYFVYQYSKQQGWTLLAFLAKAYLLFHLAIAIIFISVILFILLLLNKKGKKKKDKQENIIEAEYKIIE